MSNQIICQMNIIFIIIFISVRLQTKARSSCALWSGFLFNHRIAIMSPGIDGQYNYPSFLFLQGVPKIGVQKTRLKSAVEPKTASISLKFFLSTYMP